MHAAANNSIDIDRRSAGYPAEPHDPRALNAAFPVQAQDAITIPPQLRRPDLRFVLVRRGQKRALEAGWPTVANYPHDHITLALHIARGLPYGLFPAPGSRIAVIDADNLGRLRKLGALDSLPDTFAVSSGSSTPEHPKAHLYYELDGEPLTGRRAFFDPETGEHLGEVFAQHPGGGKGFVIGPGSCHAVIGRPYRIAEDAPIAALTRDAWARFARAVRWQDRPSRPEPPECPRAVPRTAGSSIGVLLGLSVDTVWPAPANTRLSGEWRRFAHPVHGSASGDNLAVHQSGRAWYCHRCGSSGDALTALAVDAGIIACQDAHPGCLADSRRMARVLDAARARGLSVDSADQARRNARLPPPYAFLDIAAILARIETSLRGTGA